MPRMLPRASAWSILCAMAALCLGSPAPVAQQGPEQTAPPAAPKPESAPESAPTPKAVEPSETPAGSPTQELVGLDVFSSDGTRVGSVRSVDTGPDGKVMALRVRSGGFLGFGGRTVAIPGDKFTRKGPSIRLDIDSDAVDKLPEVKE